MAEAGLGRRGGAPRPAGCCGREPIGDLRRCRRASCRRRSGSGARRAPTRSSSASAARTIPSMFVGLVVGGDHDPDAGSIVRERSGQHRQAACRRSLRPDRACRVDKIVHAVRRRPDAASWPRGSFMERGAGLRNPPDRPGILETRSTRAGRPEHGAPSPAPPRRRDRWRCSVVAVALLVTILLAGGGAAPQRDAAQPRTAGFFAVDPELAGAGVGVADRRVRRAPRTPRSTGRSRTRRTCGSRARSTASSR